MNETKNYKSLSIEHKAEIIREYFQPILEYIQNENFSAGEKKELIKKATNECAYKYTVENSKFYFGEIWKSRILDISKDIFKNCLK
jgi:hypothetical protein